MSEAERLPQRISDAQFRGARGLFAVTALFLFVVGCSSGADGQVEDRNCDVAASSDRGEVLRRILGSKDVGVDTFSGDRRFVEKMRARVIGDASQGAGHPLAACAFYPKDYSGVQRVRVEFEWVPRSDSGPARKELRGGDSHYATAGAQGESSAFISRLRFDCRLSGDAEEASRSMVLQGVVSNTLKDSSEFDQADKDRRFSFLHLVSRNTAEILECENDPLAGPPPATAYPTEAEAEAAVRR
ncbi:hypothetical protein [Streptomyces pratensis]|uniref:hypothetical protein n=1 Tax=Streptomyces pratensis TaxID=1169025 RepID=UPI003019C3E6